MNSTKENLLDSINYELSDSDEIALSDALRYILDAKNSSAHKNLTQIKKQDLYDEFAIEKLVDKSLSTKKDYKSVVLNGFLGSLYPNISRENIVKYRAGKEHIWSNATKCRNYGLINNFLKFLYEKRYIREDLSRIIEIPKRVDKKQYFPTDEDMAKFFSTMRMIYKNENDYLHYDILFRLYAKTAFRKTELISIDVEDIDFTKESIYLKKTKNKDEVYFLMDEELKDLLKSYIEKLNITEGPLLVGKGGRRIQTSVIHKVFIRIREEAQLPKGFKVHGFRRYFADRARREGVDVYILKELLRHKDVKTTLKYVDVVEKEKREALAKIKIDF